MLVAHEPGAHHPQLSRVVHRSPSKEGVLLRGVRLLISLHLSVRFSELADNRYSIGPRIVADAVGEPRRGHRDFLICPVLGTHHLPFQDSTGFATDCRRYTYA